MKTLKEIEKELIGNNIISSVSINHDSNLDVVFKNRQYSDDGKNYIYETYNEIFLNHAYEGLSGLSFEYKLV